jgi:organic radical activating enzyme
MMMEKYNHCESLYWVFTQLCNDKCDHCYNLSGPQGARISEAECLQIIENLPNSIDRLILSGGEPLAEKKLLYTILDALQARYAGRTQIMLQTNGDLLTPEILDTLIEKGVTRFDIASIDRYHKNAGARLMDLAELFESRGVNGDDKDPLINKDNYLVQEKPLSWGYWGATDDMWLGGNWARGRAMEKNIWKRDPQHNFCKILSGGIGFLSGGEGIPQEISIQLWRINPCCPGTYKAMGDARREKVAEVLARVAQSPVFQKINEGDPLGMGESVGISRAFAEARNESLQNVCLWCDEFFRDYFDMDTLQSRFQLTEKNHE